MPGNMPSPTVGKVAWVVVLGDFGRSPRMQNHACSLSRQVPTWFAELHWNLNG